LPESRHLLAATALLESLPREDPVVFRVPEGPRLRRVVQDELGRTCSWPARELLDGDRLAPGQVHLFSEPSSLGFERSPNGLIARLSPISGGGGWNAWRELLATLGSSPARLRVLRGTGLTADEAALLSIGAAREHVALPLVAPERRSARAQTSIVRAARDGARMDGRRVA
jgi:hypothetical protein